MTLDAVLAEIVESYSPPTRRVRSLRAVPLGADRAKHPGKAAVIAAVHEGGRATPDGWASSRHISEILWASSRSAVRWCDALVREGLLETATLQTFGPTGRRFSASPHYRVPVLR